MKGALLAEFAGPVQCRRESQPAALVLSGTERASGVPLELRFMAPRPAELPAIISDIDVYEFGTGEWKLRAHGGAWTLPARALLVHRDVGAAFYAALPPPRIGLGARLGWSALLGLARIPGGVRLLQFLRSR
jgi:hypothetical protein